MKKILLVDYGGVLGFDHIIENEEKLAQKLMLTRHEMNRRISEKSVNGRLYREHKLSEIEFWRRVAPSVVINDEMASALTEMWMDTYRLNTEMMAYLQSLRSSIKVGILTNIDEGRSRLLEKIVDAESNLDYYLPSYRFGVSKDDMCLWVLIKEKLKDYKVIYIDDRLEHVQSAEEVGWKGIQYCDLKTLKKDVKRVLL